eukprot:jgi/Botrbrau1/20124/Bobra.0173s0026.1
MTSLTACSTLLGSKVSGLHEQNMRIVTDRQTVQQHGPIYRHVIKYVSSQSVPGVLLLCPRAGF